MEKIQCRWDSGYFAADLAHHCVERGVEFAIGVKRNTAVVRACRTAPADGWHPVIGMEHTEVAVMEYLPGQWPKDAGISCIVRRTRIPVDQIPTDKRARKLRTIDKDQLALALAGQLDYVYGYSFILTNRDVSTPGRLVAVEHWYRLNQVSQEATSSQTTKYVRDPAGTLIGMQGNGGGELLLHPGQRRLRHPAHQQQPEPPPPPTPTTPSVTP